MLLNDDNSDVFDEPPLGRLVFVYCRESYDFAPFFL
jgi:hypothetical protein